jgi:hypothetical protein
MKVKPTTAAEFHEGTAIVECKTGRSFEIQAVNPMSLYDDGILRLPSPKDLERYEKLKNDPSKMSEDEQKMITEMYKCLVRHGVVSVDIITDPNVRADPAKNQVHYYQLKGTEATDICMKVSELSGLDLFGEGGDAVGRDEEPIRDGVEESPAVRQQEDPVGA